MNNRRVVYSTDQGKHCPECSKPLERCSCDEQGVAPGDGIVRLERQVKGRNGKPVTIIMGLPLTGADLKKLAKQLKNKCGVGGSIDAQNIIIQGDKREFLQVELERQGYTVKLSGG